MREIEVVKTPQGLRGWTEDDQRAYARMKKRIEGMEPGEIARVGFSIPRSYPFHKKFFAMLKLAYDAWDPMSTRARRKYRGVSIEKNFERFRKDILILAGYGEPFFDLQGRLHWEARSIAFDEMEQEDFEKCFDSVANVLLSQPFMAKYNRAELERVVNELMRFAEGG